jgi:hypothetical protein
VDTQDVELLDLLDSMANSQTNLEEESLDEEVSDDGVIPGTGIPSFNQLRRCIILFFLRFGGRK